MLERLSDTHPEAEEFQILMLQKASFAKLKSQPRIKRRRAKFNFYSKQLWQ